MTQITVENTTVSILELHDLTPDEFTEIIIETRRRNEPGANQFAGFQFTTETENVARFKNVDEALEFIDDIQTHGLLTAVENQLDADQSTEELLQELKYVNENVAASDFIERSGITNPFNIDIIPHIEHGVEEHARGTANTSVNA